MRTERHKNFLSLEECAALNEWAEKAVEHKWLDIGLGVATDEKPARVTSRFYGDRFKHPKFILNLSNRIREFCGISSYGLIYDHGRDGIVISHTSNGGNLHKHKDPLSKDGLYALRCNVMTSKPKFGGVLWLGDEPFELEVGELHCYLASSFLHRATEVKGDVPRILWMFGAYVPREDWDNSVIKVGAH